MSSDPPSSASHSPRTQHEIPPILTTPGSPLALAVGGGYEVVVAADVGGLFQTSTIVFLLLYSIFCSYLYTYHWLGGLGAPLRKPLSASNIIVSVLIVSLLAQAIGEWMRNSKH